MRCLGSGKYDIGASGMSGKEQGVLMSKLVIAGQVRGPACALWAKGGAVAAAVGDTSMLKAALDRSALSVVLVTTWRAYWGYEDSPGAIGIGLLGNIVSDG